MIKNNIEYIKLFMEYESKDMPIVYLYEVNLDDERLALRAIEIFEDRKLIKMDDLYRGVIEIFPIPSKSPLTLCHYFLYIFLISVIRRLP